MKVVARPRIADAKQLANGNWLITDGDRRVVLTPVEFWDAYAPADVAVACAACHVIKTTVIVTHGDGTQSRYTRCLCD